MSSLVVPAWAWALLAVLMIVLIAIDLVAHRGDHVDSRRRSLIWTVVWIGAALVFNGFIVACFGLDAGEQFLGAYLLEKSLSLDNLFVFLVIFGAFKIPASEQRRVLTWGILGALVTRGAFIAVGAALLHEWHAITYVFGAILIVTAIKTLRGHGDGPSAPSLGWLQRRLPLTAGTRGHHFFVREAGRWLATPLFAALVAIELTDVVFALDSIPAAFAVTDEPFLVYSSNVFAVLGLRALYVVLAGALADLRYLRYGLAAVLAFAGAKMLAASWMHITPLASVAIIAGCIGVAVVASVVARRREAGPSPRIAV
jgi:TerC family integral membrane protein